MSSLFDVPQQLVLILSLAASGAAEAPVVSAAPQPRAAVSAEGPMRFTEQAWLEALKQGGAAVAQASRVFRTSGGRYYIPSEADRRSILDQRREAKFSAMVAFGFARRNAADMHAILLREPTAGELYLAHAFGSETALALIEAAEENAREPVTRRFAELVQRHPELRDSDGLPFTIGQVIARMTRAADRKPSGEAVAAWFKRGPGFSLVGDLRGGLIDQTRLGDETLAAASQPAVQ